MSTTPEAKCAMCGKELTEENVIYCLDCRKMRAASISHTAPPTSSPFKKDPLLTIWTKPRETIRLIVDHDPERMVMMLAAVSGIFTVLDKMSMRSMGDRMSMHALLIYALIVGPIAGIIGLYVYSALLRWTGKWIGGRAEPQEVRAAWAWSRVITIGGGLLVTIPMIAIYGQEMFTSAMPSMASSPFLSYLAIAFAGLGVIFTIWFSVVFLICLSEVQKFSVWKAILNSILPVLVIVVPIAIIMAIVYLSK